MPETKRPLKVFLCHARADKQKVRELYRYLRKRGIQPWLDAEDLVAGQDWRVEIPRSIRSSDAIIICLSKDSINKEGFVQTEIAFALEKALEIPSGRIFIIPARLEECDVPDSLERFHWVDLFEADGFRRLMRSLRTRASQLARAAVQVPESFEPSPELTPDIETEHVAIEKPIQEEEQRAVYEELEPEIAERISREQVEREDFEKVRREKAKRAALEKAKLEKAERRSAQMIALKTGVSRSLTSFKLAVPKAIPFMRIGGILGSILVLFWIGSMILPEIPSPPSTARPSITARLTSTIALVSSPIGFTKTPEPSVTSTKPTTASPTPLPVEITDNNGVQMVLVTAGLSASGDYVSRDFYIDKYEVTNARYLDCVDTGECNPPREINSHTRSYYYGNPEFENYPVVYIQ